MNSEQLSLWHRVEQFEIDEGGAALTFTQRLARENGWHPGYAERVLREYLRFVFLLAAAGHPVTPSDQVDQAWHLHLTYSRSYWERLCGDILRRPIHHEPTRGGTQEGHKFDRWYQRTLDSYALLFDTAPPPDIWPPPHVRFGSDSRNRRVNTARHLIVGKRRLAVSVVGLALLAAFGAAWVSVARTGSIEAWNIAVLVVLFVSLAALLPWHRSGRGDSGCGGFWGDTGGDGCGGSGCGGD